MSENTVSQQKVGEAAETPVKVEAWKIHRRLYNWVLHWADTPWGVPALFVLAFIESSIFPIPPDILLIALVLGSRTKWFLFALTCTIGSVLGGLAGYGIGLLFMNTLGMKIIDFYHAHDYYETVLKWYAEYDYWIVFIAAFTPIPYKVFTIASGAFQMNVLGFLLVSLVGRGARFFLVSALLYWLGPPMKTFIEKYFDLLTILFLVALGGGFWILSYF